MLLFNIKTVWIITTIFVSIGFTGMFILYNIDKKIKLLEHEGVDMSKFFVPTKGTAI